MFPYIMIVTALIFFPAPLHHKILAGISRIVKSSHLSSVEKIYQYKPFTSYLLATGFGIFILIQLVAPFRYMLYPGELFWTEEGYRFSWRVMLVEKSGHAEFVVRDEDGKYAVVENSMFLTPLQEKMMATQPDMILQYAHILHDHYEKSGWTSPQVFVDSYVVLNGRLGKPLIDPSTDLAQQKESFSHKPWILPFQNEIKGF
jgi:hypothetical protein